MNLGAEYMDEAKRLDILSKIQAGHDKEVRVLQVTSVIPQWVERPFKEDQEKFNQELEIYKKSAPTVRQIEEKLTLSQGPVWPSLTPEEEVALQNWIGALGNLEAYVNAYFPSETQKYTAQVALLLIAAGAFIAPIFLSEGKVGLPFRIGPPRFRDSDLDVPMESALVPETPIRRPLPARAEIYRPGVPVAREGAAPWIRPAAPGGPPIGFRPAGAPGAAAPASPAGGRIFPRYRRP